MQLRFGERNHVIFNDEHEFFMCLGFLLNPRNGVSFSWEAYDNKWGIEGRIWITYGSNAPTALKNAFSAGTDTVVNGKLKCTIFRH